MSVQQDDLSQRLERARSHLEGLRKIRDRRQFEHEQNQVVLEECARQGRELGVSTPTQLLELTEKTEKEDLMAIEAFEVQIRAAAEAIRDIDQKVQEQSAKEAG